MRHYLMALLSPAGRITTGPFLLLFLPLAAAVLAIEFYIQQSFIDDMEISEWWYSIVLLLYWPQFCLVARLLQNSGIPGVFALPITALAAFDLLFRLDPTIVSTSDEEIANAAVILCQLGSASAYLLRAAILFSLTNWSSEGANAYGPPFGTESAAERQANHRRIRERVTADHRQALASDPLSRLSALERSGHMASQDAGGGAGGSKLGFNKADRRSGFGQR